jgi:hypothetical protein
MDMGARARVWSSFNVCLNSHRWFTLWLVYISYFVLAVVYGGRD